MDLETNKSFQLFFPKSRCLRSFTNIVNVDKLPGFQGRVQKAYLSASEVYTCFKAYICAYQANFELPRQI